MDNDEKQLMSDAIVSCQNLSHGFAKKQVLNNIDFTINAGEPIGLVGPNGAGKTTLFNILCGYLRPSSGNVSLFGHKPGATKLIGKVSALPQDAQLDPSFSIGAQLSFYAKLQGFSTKDANTEAIRVLEAVDLKQEFNHKPATLSHGMGKRVAIAQSFIGKPSLVFLDEPTAGLDPVNTRTIRSIIAEQTADTTFIISSHDLNELRRLCQQVLMLENGTIRSTNMRATNLDASDSSGSIDSTNANQFITLQLETYSAAEVINTLQQLAGVVAINSPQKNEYIIEYSELKEPNLDAKILMLLSEKNWSYRQLSRGKTLEEQLFF